MLKYLAHLTKKARYNRKMCKNPHFARVVSKDAPIN